MNLTQKSLVISAGRFANSSVRLLVNIIIAHLLARNLELNGHYQKVWLLFNTFYWFFVFGIPESLYYFLPRLEKEEQPSFLNQTYYLLFIQGALFTVFLYLFSWKVRGAYHVPELPVYYTWFAFYGGLMVASSFLDSLFIVADRHKLVAGFQILEALLFLAAVVLPLVFTGGITLSLQAVTLLALLRLAALHLLVRRYLPHLSLGPPQLSWRRILPQLKFALPIAVTNIVAFLASFMDKNIVAFFIASNAVYTIYAYGAMEIPFISIFLGSLDSVILPDISRLHHQGKLPEIVALLRKTVARAVFLVWPMFLLFMIIAPAAFTVVYGEKFAASAQPFRLYLLLLPLRVLYYGRILTALGRARTVTLLAAADLVVNFLLSVTLVQRLGMVGPALATVLATYLEIAVFFLILGRVLRAPVRAFLPGDALLRALLTSGVAVIPLLLCRLFISASLPFLLAGGTLFVLTYLWALYYSGDLQEIKRLVLRK